MIHTTQYCLINFAAINQLFPCILLQMRTSHLCLTVTWAAPTCLWEPMAPVSCAILDVPPSCILFQDITDEIQLACWWGETWLLNTEAHVWNSDHYMCFSALVCKMCSSWICLQKPVQWGTLRYMSPEILEGSVHLHNKWYLMHADIYSLALLLWEIWMCCTDFSHGTLSRYLQVPWCRSQNIFFVFPVPVYRKCCSTASVAIWIRAGSQCVHREPHFARLSHGHETFHTATLGRVVTGIPKYSMDVVNVLLLNSFITCRGLSWRRSWQILGTLNQMLVSLLSVLQTDWPLSIVM